MLESHAYHDGDSLRPQGLIGFYHILASISLSTGAQWSPVERHNALIMEYMVDDAEEHTSG